MDGTDANRPVGATALTPLSGFMAFGGQVLYVVLVHPAPVRPAQAAERPHSDDESATVRIDTHLHDTYIELSSASSRASICGSWSGDEVPR